MLCATNLLVSASPLASGSQIDPQSALLERAAWNALAAGDVAVAATAFRQALAADPKNARLHLGTGIVASLEHRDEDARAALTQALALDPKLTQARVVLGQVLHRMGDSNGAIRTYEELVAAAPGDRDAAAMLARWRREAELHERMQDAIGSAFVVSFDGPAEAAIAQHALEALDSAYWRIGAILGLYPTEPVRVVLYTAEQFSDITRSPSWAAGAYDGIVRVPVRGALDDEHAAGELDRVLAHEFTHALIRSVAPSGVPAWLNEGLATALESPAGATPAGQPAARVPLRALTGSFGRLSGPQAQAAYATSAAAARRLLQDAGGYAIANLLRDLGAGVPFDAAFEHRIQRPFADFDRGT